MPHDHYRELEPPAGAAEREPSFALTPPPADAARSRYVVSLDGRLIRVAHAADGVELTINGRHPLTLDAHQAAALQAVIYEMLDGGR